MLIYVFACISASLSYAFSDGIFKLFFSKIDTYRLARKQPKNKDLTYILARIIKNVVLNFLSIYFRKLPAYTNNYVTSKNTYLICLLELILYLFILQRHTPFLPIFKYKNTKKNIQQKSFFREKQVCQIY